MTKPAARVTAPARSRRGPASTQDGQRSRDRVLKAALDLITEAGIDQVRLAEIARREHQDTRRRRASLGKVTGAWRQLERFISLYLPSSLADPSWILWMVAWARAPHDTEVSQFLDELLRPWRDDLAAIVERGVQEGAFAPQNAIGDFTIRFPALLDGLAILRLRQMPKISRKRLIELAMSAAHAELTQARLPH